jgi:hypothetical protein
VLHQNLVFMHQEAASQSGQPPRDIGQLTQTQEPAPRKDSLPHAPSGGDQPVVSAFEFAREDLRYVSDLGDGEFGQVVQMEITGGPHGAMRQSTKQRPNHPC